MPRTAVVLPAPFLVESYRTRLDTPSPREIGRNARARAQSDLRMFGSLSVFRFGVSAFLLCSAIGTDSVVVSVLNKKDKVTPQYNFSSGIVCKTI